MMSWNERKGYRLINLCDFNRTDLYLLCYTLKRRLDKTTYTQDMKLFETDKM